MWISSLLHELQPWKCKSTSLLSAKASLSCFAIHHSYLGVFLHYYYYMYVFKLLLFVRLCQHVPLSPPCFLSHPPSIPLSLHHFLSVWVSMQSDPGELITVGARVAGTKTLHRQHNSDSRNQTGSTQSSLTGPAQISSAQQSHTHRAANPRPAFRSAGLKPALIIL